MQICLYSSVYRIHPTIKKICNRLFNQWVDERENYWVKEFVGHYIMVSLLSFLAPF